MYTVILIFPGHRIEIPANSLSTAKVAYKRALLDAEGLVRVKVMQGQEVIMMVNAIPKESAA